MPVKNGGERKRYRVYKVYIIDFAPNSNDFPNSAGNTKFRCVIATDLSSIAWAVAKSERIDHHKYTVIIDPNGVPIGGY